MAPPGGLPWNCASDQSVSRTLQIGATAGWLDSTLDLGQAGRVDLSLESLVRRPKALTPDIVKVVRRA